MSSVAPAVEPARSRALLGSCRDLRAHPLCARRKPRHPPSLRPSGRDRVRGCSVLCRSHDPLASDTAAALKPPSAAHWFAPISGPRHLQPRHRGHEADTFIAVASVVLCSCWAASPALRRLFRRLDRPHRRRIADTIMAFRCSCWRWASWRARQHCAEHHHRTAIVNFPFTRGWRVPKPMCGATPVLSRRRGCRQWRIPDSAGAHPANIMPIMTVQMSLTMGYAILNAAGLSFIGLGVRPPTAEWASWSRKARASWCRANGGSRCSGPGADDRGVLLQPASATACAISSIPRRT